MKPNVEVSSFGKLPDGTPVRLFSLRNSTGLVAKISDYGTIITELHVPDRSGKNGDVVLGFDNLEQYLKGHPYFGCTVGRVANRIAKGRFTLEGTTYTLAINNGPNHLHGGLKGFDKVVWKAEPQPGAAVQFTYNSADGEEGYPGKLDVTVRMTLTEKNELTIEYSAVTDKPTPVNLTNHSYFNLACQGDILGHELVIAADNYTPKDENSIPTGIIAPVRGTPMDFLTPHAIGSRFAELKEKPVGYDHNFVLNGGGKSLALAARVFEPKSGRVMEVLTTEPGVQLYTSNFLDGSLTGKHGMVYRQHSGVCLETQHFPDSVNHPQFPSIILGPGQTYRQTTVHKFTTA
ncbi:MAG TPA: aldose epimerase family protein [Patescibacteria group bacterium]|nr:aldose epimerase family protein [Patescibacteria group bacterium]